MTLLFLLFSARLAACALGAVGMLALISWVIGYSAGYRQGVAAERERIYAEEDAEGDSTEAAVVNPPHPDWQRPPVIVRNL